jgi:hypothetical protein
MRRGRFVNIAPKEHARELMRKVGRNRDKLSEAAAKIFRKQKAAKAIFGWLLRHFRRGIVLCHTCSIAVDLISGTSRNTIEV